jgi:hypothetical protein
MKTLIFSLFLMLILVPVQNGVAQILNNYSVYSFAPGISSSTDKEYNGISLTANGAAGTNFLHGELSSTIGYGDGIFMNEYLSLDLAVGIPFKTGVNSEALIALSPFSINLTVDGNVGLATLLKFRYGKLFLESKLLLTEYKQKPDEPFLRNNSYFSVRRRLGDSFGLGIRYTSFSDNYGLWGLYIFYGFEEN